MNIAFAGFRHVHIDALYKLAVENPDVNIVAAWEENEPAREAAEKKLGVKFTHNTYSALLADKSVEAVAIGDAYGKRGALAIAALEAGKHVISDKPLCTSLREMERIQSLSKSKGLTVGCMLDMRYLKSVSSAKAVLDSGALGELHAISFGGQHPLMYGSRPMWYFEHGMHGGTINDIAVHGIDMVKYLTGKRVAKPLFARCWNAFAKEAPHFKDCAQFMAELDGGAGLMGDVSYAAPNSCGYALPLYWRFTFWGEKGVMEFSSADEFAKVALDGDSGFENVSAPAPEGDVLRDFLAECAGKPNALTSEDAFYATRMSLTLQAAAQ